MNRSDKHIRLVEELAKAIVFTSEAENEKNIVQERAKIFYGVLEKITPILHGFPLLYEELSSILTLNNYTFQNSEKLIEQIRIIEVKINFIHDIISDIEEINDEQLTIRLTLAQKREQFRLAALRLNTKNIDTLHFELKKLEEQFKKVNADLSAEYQKRQKLSALIKQDFAIYSQFPKIQSELNEIIANKNPGTKVASVLTDYPVILNQLKQLSEYATYFSRLNNDYNKVINIDEVKEILEIKSLVTLQSLYSKFQRVSSRALSNKNRILKLALLREKLTQLKTELPGKIYQLPVTNQKYVLNEIAEAEHLLFDELGLSFDKADAKLYAVQELLKKSHTSLETRTAEALRVRQIVARHETSIWSEHTTQLYEELNAYINGTNTWRIDDFDIALSRLVREKNEAIQAAKSEFEKLLVKDRNYRNEIERFIHTKTSFSDFEKFVKRMGGFRFFKMVLYKFK